MAKSISLVILTWSVLLTSSMLAKRLSKDEIAIREFQRPINKFSSKLLFRVAEYTNFHFVFSPLSSWLQMVTLAEGARGVSPRQLKNLTGYQHGRNWLLKFFLESCDSLDQELSVASKRQIIAAIDVLLDVNKSYEEVVNSWNNSKILTLNFNDAINSANLINDMIESATEGVIVNAIEAKDFYLRAALLIEATYLKSDWQVSFNAVYTRKEPFYSEENLKIGEVNMMSQTGYFKVAYIPSIKSKVLELPFQSERVSMLVLLPEDETIKEIFYNLRFTKVSQILKSFKNASLMNVSLPRFAIRSVVDNIPELLFDMGMTSVFDPDLANFSGITKFKMHNSMIQQVADIEVIEQGVTASAIIAESVLGQGAIVDNFVANKPFAYLIVDKVLNVILFAGIYSEPSIY